MFAKHNERTNNGSTTSAPITKGSPMTAERQILTAYRQLALNRLRNAHVALWRTLPCQNGDNKIEVWLNTEYGATQSGSKEFSEFMHAAMSIGCAEGAADAQFRDAAVSTDDSTDFE
jgi:hypothetical protein